MDRFPTHTRYKCSTVGRGRLILSSLTRLVYAQATSFRSTHTADCGQQFECIDIRSAKSVMLTVQANSTNYSSVASEGPILSPLHTRRCVLHLHSRCTTDPLDCMGIVDYEACETWRVNHKSHPQAEASWATFPPSPQQQVLTAGRASEQYRCESSLFASLGREHLVRQLAILT